MGKLLVKQRRDLDQEDISKWCPVASPRYCRVHSLIKHLVKEADNCVIWFRNAVNVESDIELLNKRQYVRNHIDQATDPQLRRVQPLHAEFLADALHSLERYRIKIDAAGKHAVVQDWLRRIEKVRTSVSRLVHIKMHHGSPCFVLGFHRHSPTERYVCHSTVSHASRQGSLWIPRWHQPSIVK
nr:hypothetical protein X990_3039 [Burkholderia pseudomallei MSHR4868]